MAVDARYPQALAATAMGGTCGPTGSTRERQLAVNL